MRLIPRTAAWLLACLPTIAWGHHFWLEPHAFVVSPGQEVSLRLFVADALNGEREEHPARREKVETFRMLNAKGVTDLVLVEGAKPFHVFRAPSSGTVSLALERHWTPIELEAAKFEDYLREEGLGDIVTERARRGERRTPGREQYRRSIKTILQVGQGADATPTPAGQRLEIVPLANPYAIPPGGVLELQVLFEGKPLAHHALFAETRAGPKRPMRTDANGRSTVTLDAGGVWLVRLVHMRRCVSGCGAADWESYWSSLTFAR